MATATIEVAHVYTALAKILKHLSVEKNGTLPGNMGGKAYITAVDISAEVKRQFVENDLIFLPDERVIEHETIQFKDRLNVTIVVKGTYTIASIVDGSSVTVSGTGDGLATGTAVASNIASTNALKNALLRTFLITEQSVEDQSKNGEETIQNSATQRARQAPARPATKEHPDKVKVREWIGTNSARRDQANAASDKFKKEGVKGDDIWTAIAKEVIK